LPEGPGTGFLQKKRVPGGLLGASLEEVVPRILFAGIPDSIRKGRDRATEHERPESRLKTELDRMTY